MISKAAEFKNILNGKYKNMYDVDIELYHAMCRLGWKIFKEHYDGVWKSISYRSNKGDEIYTFEGESKWNNDIVKSLRLLNRL